MMVLLSIILLPVSGLPAPNVDICALVETLPAPKDPYAGAPPFRKSFTALTKAGTTPGEHKRLYRVFDRAGRKLLSQARRLFHPKRGKVKRSRIERFLKDYVYTTHPSLVIEGDGFDLTVAVRTALAYTACRSMRLALAVSHARRPGQKPAALMAYAAALLIGQGRLNEARELVPALDTRGFLGPWVLGMLTPKAKVWREQIGRLKSRVRHKAQRDALTRLTQRRWKDGKGGQP